MKSRRLSTLVGSRTQVRQRTGLVGLLFVGGFGVLFYRVACLHVVSDPRLERLVKTQYQTTLPHLTPRGTIYDSEGEVLAISVPTMSLAVRPRRMTAPQQLAKKLSPLLSIPEKEILERLRSEKRYVWLKRQLTPPEVAGVRTLDDPGLEWVDEARRYYPNRELSSQILGAVGFDGSALGGMELAYDALLKGKGEPPTTYRDARGTEFELPDTLESEEEPYDLWLSLNRSIQYVLESELKGVCAASRAKSCTGIVMEAKTGAILAMASVPSFNPNTFRDYEWARWKNRAITDGFEPGSIFKVVLAAAALETQAVSPEDRFFCENGALRIGRHVIHDHKPHGLLSFREILKVSSNIGFYKIGQRVGKEGYWEMIQKLGFGKKTGVDFPGEDSGFILPANRWGDIEFANISFGHGVRVTPLQVARVFSVIASGGYDVTPHFVHKVTRGNGELIWKASQRHQRLIKESTVRLLTSLLVDVTGEGGTGIQAGIPAFRVAGKTGTAQKVKGKGYSHRDFMSSFVGFAPAEDPRVTGLIVVDEPRGEIYGGLVAAPVFSRVIWAALRELGVAPQRDEKRDPVPWMRASLPSTSGNWLLPRTAHQEPSGVPDFRGLSLREVLALLEAKRIPAELEGSGVAYRQEPSPGSLLQEGQRCRILFQALP